METGDIRAREEIFLIFNIMSEQLNIGADNIDYYWTLAEYIDKGDDSEVRGFLDMAIKRYPNLPLEQLKFYQEVTGEVGARINGKIIKTALGNFALKVNPVTGIIESAQDSTVYSLSPRISGTNMHHGLLQIGQSAFNEFEVELEPISTSLIRDIKVGGIYLIPYNILLTDSANQGRELIVTDIASYVSRIVALP